MKKKLCIMIVLLVVIFILLLALYMNTKKRQGMSFKIEGYIVSGEENFLLNSGDDIESGENISGEMTISGETQGEFKEAVAGASETKKTEITNELKSNSLYYIKINNLQNVVTVYYKDAEGNYTVPIRAMVCSTGDATPVAGKKHKITTYKQRWNALQGNVYGQYATQIVGNILFHSVPYTAKKNSALEYWEYDKLGTKASLGCIRLTVEDAKWVYDNIPSGTIVEFYEDKNPGPLGKPAAQKISDNEECRNWDPTDLADGNPWTKEQETDSGEFNYSIDENKFKSGDIKTFFNY